MTTSFALMKPGIISFCLACSDDCRLRGAAFPGSMCCGSKPGPLQASTCELSLSLCLWLCLHGDSGTLGSCVPSLIASMLCSMWD